MFVSQFVPDDSQMGPCVAGLWQGDVPATLKLHLWLYRARGAFLVWEGDAEAREYVERAFGSFGELTTEPVTDSTEGLAACFARDLDGFGEWMRQRGGRSEAEIVDQLDLRRRGLAAATPDEAYEAGTAWAEEQAAR